jgi:hypothetical protein
VGELFSEKKEKHAVKKKYITGLAVIWMLLLWTPRIPIVHTSAGVQARLIVETTHKFFRGDKGRKKLFQYLLEGFIFQASLPFESMGYFHS